MSRTVASRAGMLWCLGLVLGSHHVVAQTEEAASTPPPVLRRASWLTDERTFRTGDIITIVVDERVAARERTSKTATASRNQRNQFGIQEDGSLGISPSSLGFNTGIDSESRDIGEANRQGDLAAVLSVRVIGFEPGGILRVRGERFVKVDGREQTVTIEGLVRTEDVSSSNIVLSSRVADASISYDGKNIAPRRGIIASLLSIFWP